jgi:hypothetical protein
MKLAPSRAGRKGIAIVMALVLIATLAVIFSVVATQIVAQRQVLRQRHRQLQADWLARAGVELAAARLLAGAAAFSEEKQDLLPDSKVRISVDKIGQDSYVVAVEAQVGEVDEPPMVRTAKRSFRRTEENGVVHLRVIPPEVEKS